MVIANNEESHAFRPNDFPPSEPIGGWEGLGEEGGKSRPNFISRYWGCFPQIRKHFYMKILKKCYLSRVQKNLSQIQLLLTIMEIIMLA